MGCDIMTINEVVEKVYEVEKNRGDLRAICILVLRLFVLVLKKDKL